MESILVKVGMADLQVAESPGRLRTTGLGSCVGVALYDPLVKIGGLAHVMLPSQSLSRGDTNRAKYADTAIPLLLEKMEQSGANRKRIVAKLAGGAQMFKFQSSHHLSIGQRNVEECHQQLRKADIPVVAEDTGGNYGRTIELDTLTGILYVRSVNTGEKKL
jgi:chemotaxis protein CheD